MNVKKSIKCPNCGAEVRLYEVHTTTVDCMYCGTKINLQNAVITNEEKRRQFYLDFAGGRFPNIKKKFTMVILLIAIIVIAVAGLLVYLFVNDMNIP